MNEPVLFGDMNEYGIVLITLSLLALTILYIKKL